MSSEPNPEVVAYIAQHRATYTREAIDAQLRAAGHAPEAIAAAWQAVEATDQPADEARPSPEAASQPAGGADQTGAPTTAATGATPVRPATPSGSALVRSPLFWATLVGFVLVVYALPFIFAGAMPDNDDAAGIGALAALLVWLAGLVAAFVLARRRPVLARGLLFGFAAVFLIPFVGLVIVAGVCIVALSQQGLM